VKILGIPTKVEGSFFLISFVLGATRSQSLPLLIEWLLVVLVSVLLHELGHALVARKFGLAPSIKLYAMGGLTFWDSEVNLTPFKHLLISLAGPAAGLLLGGVVFFAGRAVLGSSPSRLVVITYFDLLWVNVGWGIFNLLPMIPLDGGQVLLTLEEWITKRKDQIISHVISLVVALGITYLALARSSVWIAILGVWFVYANGSFLVQKLQTYRDQKIRPLLEQARDAFTKSEFDKALDLTRRAKKTARTASVRREAAHLLIFLLIHQRQLEKAEKELKKFNAVFGEDSYLNGLFYFQKEEMASAIPYLKLSFDGSPTEQVGMLLYQALIDQKRYVEALEMCGHTVLSEVSWKLYVNLQNEAFESSEFQVAAQAGSLAFEKQPDPNVAYNIACSLARDAKITEAFNWLERAIESGFSNKDLLATDSDLAALRVYPEFEAIIAKMPT
jgi:Zn-dependent protease